MKNKAIITVLLCIVTIQLKAQNPEQVVREYISALNEWLASPLDTQKKEKVEAIMQSDGKKCTIQDEIIEKYNSDAGVSKVLSDTYLSILNSKIKKKGIKVEIIKNYDNPHNELDSMDIATAILKYSGDIALTTAVDFWIQNGKINNIVTNQMELYNYKNKKDKKPNDVNSNTTPTPDPNHSETNKSEVSNRINQKDNTYEMLIKDQNYMEGLGAYYSRDYQTAFKKWMICANQNNITAQRLIGYCYFKGLGVEQSIKNAKIWYKKAADAGDIYAEEYCRILLENYN